ncbi:Alpha-L-rhamnosidase like protein [Verticillium longisporum]|nr:Alpha-L-rhamnosidase like protein [Verticillium longisporum]
MRESSPIREVKSEAEGAEVRVRARGADSETPWSDWVHVETGLTNKWEDVSPITTLCKQPTDGPKRPIYFRKDFDVPSNLRSARLYITALGLYEAEINGRRVGDHVLAPGWQSYNHRHVYDTYDVTEMLVAGEKSVLGAVIGEGWFSGRLGWGGGNRNIYGDTLGLLAVLILTAEDGTTIEIPTDASWKSLTEGPIISGEIYNGEHFDDRIAAEIEGWATRSFNASGWSGTRSLDKLKGRLASPDQPPIRVTEEIKPQRIFKSPSGKTLVDFGQNLVGWLRIRATGPSGHRIQLRHAEVLEDGELARRPLRQAWQEEQVWLSGREITYEPKFTYHGFRFAQVDDWPAETPLDADHLIAVVVHTDMEQTGWFESSNELINKFHSNAQNWIDKGVARNSDGLWDRTKFQFGDWLDPESPFDNPAQPMTSPYLVADAYLVQMTGLLADIVEALGEAGDVTAYALALEFDLFSNVKDLTNGTDTLRQLIADNDYLVGTGFAGTAPLGGALTKANATEYFYRMLLQEKNPSWLYQVVMGGTTTWERWDSLLPDGSLNPGEMLSFNHYAFGSVADWIH